MISLLLFGLIAILWSLRELNYQNKLRLKGPFFNDSSWVRKYRSPMEPAPRTWYYSLFKIKYVERFPGSATIFVTFTDFLHTAQFAIKLLLIACIVFYEPTSYGILDPILFWLLFGGVFTLTYRLFQE